MIVIDGFQKRYRHAAVHIAHLTLPEKSILKGPNGCGKSTLFKALGGLITYQGTLNHPQNTLYLPVQAPLPDRPIGDFYRYGSSLSRALMTDFFDLKEYPLRPKACSSGMQQKLRLIHTLMWPADFYLLDEPLHGLDIASAEWAMRVLHAMSAPVSIITHIPHEYPAWKTVHWPL